MKGLDITKEDFLQLQESRAFARLMKECQNRIAEQEQIVMKSMPNIADGEAPDDATKDAARKAENWKELLSFIESKIKNST